jgi:hypothetical protein
MPPSLQWRNSRSLGREAACARCPTAPAPRRRRRPPPGSGPPGRPQRARASSEQQAAAGWSTQAALPPAADTSRHVTRPSIRPAAARAPQFAAGGRSPDTPRQRGDSAQRSATRQLQRGGDGERDTAHYRYRRDAMKTRAGDDSRRALAPPAAPCRGTLPYNGHAAPDEFRSSPTLRSTSTATTTRPMATWRSRATCAR